MRTAIDALGRVVVPKTLRDQLGLVARRELEITLRDGALLLQPLSTQVKLVRRGRRLVAEPRKPLPRLTGQMVRDALESTRR